MNPVEIETIVRNVLNTLLAGNSTGTNIAPQELAIAEQVVSVASLAGKLAGINTLRLNPSAVVTPAARDLCRQSNVAIVKGEHAIVSSYISMPQQLNLPQQSNAVAAAEGNRPQRLVVAGACSTMAAIAKQVCPKQAKVLEPSQDDSNSLRCIAAGLRNGHQAGVLISRSPHALCWQAARDDKLRPAVVSQWNELPSVLLEVPVNLIILSSTKWNIPSICNAIRHLFEHLKRTN